MAENAPVLPGLSPVGGRPVHVTFDGGRLTSDAGVLILAEIERRLGIAERLARCIEDPRAPERVRHGLAEMIRFRALMIAAGYADANDCNALRADPAFRLAVGRLPESGAELCSQPTMTRLENLPSATALKRMMAAMVELFCDSFSEVPRRIVLDIDDTEDRAHGRQQLSLFHAHYDSRCFLPIHIYEATTGKPVAVILRPGKTPDGAEVALVLRHVVRAIRSHWPAVDILIRGDGHYSRPEAMAWLERNRVGYVFGLAGNRVLLKKVADLAEHAAMARIAGKTDKARRYGEFRYAARTWPTERQVIARVEASAHGNDSRFIVTNLKGAPRWLYDEIYCARGQAENLIKAHKLHLASDRPRAARPNLDIALRKGIQ
jgi:Transposase DDE domain group 1